MPISRDPRMDRRRRVLRDNGTEQPPAAGARNRRGKTEDQPESTARRGAGYSQDVRNACGHRLVQLIPIRLRSYAAAMFASFAIPAFLLLAHYMIYVSGRWPWWGHPLAIAFDASHPQGIASWFCSHLWLLCLGATLLTFQLRKHKLDDYNGEYRLWFWLVITCLIASIDSTTHITELFGLSLNNWTQLNLGWSGPAVVKGTMAVLIGMLGLRLCTELKTVPSSLIFWLLGLVAWAGSAALSQEELKIELTVQFRIWLKCALWLGGLTAIWLAALSYLRSTYIEAQRRFLLRGRLAANVGMPIGQRLRESMPRMPSMPSLRRSAEAEDGEPTEKRHWGIPGFKRKAEADDADEAEVRSKTPSVDTNAAKNTSANQRKEAPVEKVASDEPLRGLGGFLRAGKQTPVATDSSAEAPAEARDGKRFAVSGWFRKAKDDGEAAEFRKVKQEQRAEAREQARLEREERKAEKRARKTQPKNDQREDSDEPKKPRSWVPKLGRPKMPSVRLPKMKSPRGWLPKFKLPSFSLNSLRLSPPQEGESEEKAAKPEMRPVRDNRPLPGTNDGDDSDEPRGRPLTKAERKRQRRLQQQQNRAA